VPSWQRKAVIESIACVDEVIVYSGPNEHNLLKQIKKQYKTGHKDKKENITFTVFHSAWTHNKDFIPGEGIADRLMFCPDFDSMSTSDIMAVIKEKG
jgi:hypothetical protein